MLSMVPTKKNPITSASADKTVFCTVPLLMNHGVMDLIHNIEGICRYERVTRKIKSESQEFISRLESLEIGMGRILVDFLSLNWALLHVIINYPD